MDGQGRQTPGIMKDMGTHIQLPHADCKCNSGTSAAQPSKAFPKEAQGDLQISKKQCPEAAAQTAVQKRCGVTGADRAKKIEELEHLLYEERLREVGPFRSKRCLFPVAQS